MAELTGVLLLTGGTGFLGAQVARRVVRDTDLSLFALVRANGPEEAVRRAEREWWGWPELRGELGRRVVVAAGDVSIPNLGLEESEYDGIARRVTHVIHAAADLRLEGPLDEMRKTNVKGTANVLALASEANEDHGLKRFSHISTAYVCGRTRGPIREERAVGEDGFRNAYELTKFEAEDLVRRSGERFPISILRPGMVVGDSRTGEIRTFNTIYHPLRMLFDGGLRVVPVPASFKVNIVPVDYVADSVVRLTTMSEAEGLTFHLTSPTASLPTVGELVGFVRSWAEKSMGLALPRPLFLPIRSAKANKARSPAVFQERSNPAGRLDELESYCSGHVSFDRDNTDRVIGRYEFDWRAAFPNLLRFAVYHGFLHPRPRTVHETILQRLGGRSMPVSIADIFDGKVVRRDSGQVRLEMLSARNALHSMGIAKGDRVAVVGLNSSRYLTLDVAIGLAGAVSVPIYYTSPPGEIAYILAECGAKALFVGAPDVMRSLAGSKLGIPVVSFCRKDPPGVLLEHLTWEEFLGKGPAIGSCREGSPAGFGDLATVRYTSGTTGRPKGVRFDHQNLRWLAESVCSLFPWKARSREITYLSFLPLNHCVEGMICAYAPYYAPASLSVYFLEDFKRLGEALPTVRPTVFFSVPRFYEKAWEGLLLTRGGRLYAGSRGLGKAVMRPLVRRAFLSRTGLGRCEQLMVGSAPVNRALLDDIQGLGVEVHDAYGLTEAPLVTMNLPGRNVVGTVGEPLPETAVRISKEGEILVKGPQVARAYVSGAMETVDGYLATGDLGRMDGTFLTVEGRKKELIKTSYGKYVQPGLVEAMLRGIKDVDEAMLVGEGRPFCVALIWVKKGSEMAKASASVEEGVARVNAKLSHPEQVRKWATLENDLTIAGGELTANMKLRRAVVSARYLAVIEGLYSGHSTALGDGSKLEVPLRA